MNGPLETAWVRFGDRQKPIQAGFVAIITRCAVASSEQAANPLFLRALLEELRVFGTHERLDERIDYYTSRAQWR